MNSYGVITTNKISYSSNKGGDSIKGRICYYCYDKVPWENFVVEDGIYSEVCMDCLSTLKDSINLKNYRYILYLHPKKTNPIYPLLDEYWCKAKYFSRQHGIKNECIKYPFHATLVSFFNMVDIHPIIKKIIELKEEYPIRYINIGKRYRVKDEQFQGVHIYSIDLVNLLEKLKDSFPWLIIKEDLHLSLYHNIDRSYLEIYDKLLLNLGNFSNDNMEWDMVLWKTNGHAWKIIYVF